VRALRYEKRGFTLIELLICLTILVIVYSLGAPTFATLRHNAQSARFVSQAVTLLNYARFEAVMRGTEVTFCATDKVGKCQRKWLLASSTKVFIDANENRTYDSPDTLLRTSELSLGSGVMTWKASLARNYVTFDATGFTWQNGSFIFCPDNGDLRNARAIVVSQAGRSYLTIDRDNDGIREDRSGNPLVC